MTTALVCLALLATGEAQPHELFVAANAAFDRGDFDTAGATYTELLDKGFVSGPLYFNLGNARLRQGHVGEAIAAYRRSLAIDPRNPETLANLAVARRQAKDALAPAEPSATQQALLAWHHGLSRRELFLAGAAANALLWACLALRLVAQRRTLLTALGGVAAVVAIACLGSAGVRHSLPLRVAVVLSETMDTRTGPSPSAVVRFSLHAGAEVRWDRHDGEWVRLQLPDGAVGWAPRESVALLEL